MDGGYWIVYCGWWAVDSGERVVQNLEYRVKFRVECRVYVSKKIGATEEVSPVTHRALPLSTGNLGCREQAKCLITSKFVCGPFGFPISGQSRACISSWWIKR